MIRTLLAVGAAAIFLAGCGGDDDSSAGTSSNDATQDEADVEVQTDAEEDAEEDAEGEDTGSPDGDQDPNTTPVSFAGYLAAGDCFDHQYDDDGAYDFSWPPPIVDCGQVHDNEVVAVHVLDEGPGAAYPDEDAWNALFDDFCIPEFTGFLGIDGPPEALGGYYLSPDEQEWDDGARTMACVLYLPDARLDGSLRGVGQNVLPASFPTDAPVPKGITLSGAGSIEDSYSPSDRFAGDAGIDIEGFFGATFEGGEIDETKAALEQAIAASDWELVLDDSLSGIATTYYALQKQDAELIVEIWELEGGGSRVHYFYLPG